MKSQKLCRICKHNEYCINKNDNCIECDKFKRDYVVIDAPDDYDEVMASDIMWSPGDKQDKGVNRNMETNTIFTITYNWSYQNIRSDNGTWESYIVPWDTTCGESSLGD